MKDKNGIELKVGDRIRCTCGCGVESTVVERVGEMGGLIPVAPKTFGGSQVAWLSSYLVERVPPAHCPSVHETVSRRYTCALAPGHADDHASQVGTEREVRWPNIPFPLAAGAPGEKDAEGPFGESPMRGALAVQWASEDLMRDWANAWATSGQLQPRTEAATLAAQSPLATDPAKTMMLIVGAGPSVPTVTHEEAERALGFPIPRAPGVAVWQVGIDMAKPALDLSTLRALATAVRLPVLLGELRRQWREVNQHGTVEVEIVHTGGQAKQMAWFRIGDSVSAPRSISHVHQRSELSVLVNEVAGSLGRKLVAALTPSTTPSATPPKRTEKPAASTTWACGNVGVRR